MCACRGDESATPEVRPALVRQGRVADAGAVAALHASQIGEGFLSSLGPVFLERLYRRMCRTEGAFALVAERDGDVVGFVAGATSTRRLFSTFLLRDGVAVCLRSPLRLLSGWRRALETLRHGRQDGPAGDAGAELLSIAVDPGARRQGVAALLVRGLLEEVARRGSAGVDVVVGAGNGPAIALYRSAGFTPVRRFELHAGTESLLMRHPGGVGPTT